VRIGRDFKPKKEGNWFTLEKVWGESFVGGQPREKGTKQFSLSGWGEPEARLGQLARKFKLVIRPVRKDLAQGGAKKRTSV